MRRWPELLRLAKDTVCARIYGIRDITLCAIHGCAWAAFCVFMADLEFDSKSAIKYLEQRYDLY